MDKRIPCNFRLPETIYEIIKEKSNSKYLSMTDYLIQLVLEDIKKESIINVNDKRS